MDGFKILGEVGLGSRLKRLSDLLMKETQDVYDENNIDFDPYLFPVFHNVWQLKKTTNTQLRDALGITQPAITQTLHKLKAKNLILISPDEVDKRKKVVQLSDKGLAQRVLMQPIWDAIDATIDEITSAKVNSMLEYIGSLEDAVLSKAFISNIRKRIAK